MVATKYRVQLTDDERTRLTKLISRGAAPAQDQTHARILLKADQAGAGPAWTDVAIAEAFSVSERTVIRVRRAWATAGIEAATHRRRARATRPPRLDGEQEAQLIALACSDPPAGHQRWTLRLLARRAVEVEIVDGIAPNTVRRALKKTISSPG